MNQFYTYIHTRNDTGDVFYVGKGRGDRSHQHKSRNRHWKNIVTKHGLTVHKAMTHLTEQEAFEHEKFLIICLRDMGVRLVNLTDGGEGPTGFKHSPETRARMSLAQKGRTISEEGRRNMGLVRIGHTTSAETREKISAAQRGDKCSAELRAKRAASATGRTPSEETRAKLSAARRKRVISKETGAKLSAARMGHEVTAETREKISAAHKGVPLSLAHRAALVESHRIRRMNKAGASNANTATLRGIESALDRDGK